MSCKIIDKLGSGQATRLLHSESLCNKIPNFFSKDHWHHSRAVVIQLGYQHLEPNLSAIVGCHQRSASGGRRLQFYSNHCPRQQWSTLDTRNLRLSVRPSGHGNGTRCISEHRRKLRMGGQLQWNAVDGLRYAALCIPQSR